MLEMNTLANHLIREWHMHEKNSLHYETMQPDNLELDEATEVVSYNSFYSRHHDIALK